MSRKLIGQYRLRAYHAHMIAGTETRTPVDPATVDISDRIFTSEEEEHLPESMCDGHVMRRERGDLTNAACIHRICDLISRGVTETDARQYIGVSASEWGRWRVRNECNVNEKIALATSLQHIATADECIKILKALERRRGETLTAYNAEVRTYNKMLSEWRAQPEGQRGPGPVEPVYDGPSELDVKIAQSIVQHLQWKLEKRSPDYIPKSQNTTHNIFEEIRTAVTPQDAMQKYVHYIDVKPE